MKIFDDMTFEGTPDALEKFIERLDQLPQIGPWTRDQEAEQEQQRYGISKNACRFYRLKDRAGFPDARLWIFAGEKGEGRWRVPNVVPAVEDARFAEETYYLLLTSFREATLPFANEVGVKISVPRLEVGPEYWLTEKQVKLLDHFSQNGNRSTRSAHPQYRKRWHDFIIAVHRDGSDVSGADVGRILFEYYHWSDRMANELAIEFDQQLDLLRDFAKSA
jgi:hypothetical protein